MYTFWCYVIMHKLSDKAEIAKVIYSIYLLQTSLNIALVAEEHIAYLTTLEGVTCAAAG